MMWFDWPDWPRKNLKALGISIIFYFILSYYTEHSFVMAWGVFLFLLDTKIEDTWVAVFREIKKEREDNAKRLEKFRNEMSEKVSN